MNEPTRVLHLAPDLNAGSGIGEYAERYRNVVREQGLVICPLDVPARSLNSWRDVRRYARAATAASESGFDLVHAELGGGALRQFYAALAVGRRGRIPLVVTLHDPPRPVWWPFHSRAVRRTRVVGALVRRLTDVPARWIERRVLRHAAKVFVLTEAAAAQMSDLVGTGRVLRIAYPTSPAGPAAGRAINGTLRLGYFGYWFPGKGLEYLVEGLARARERGVRANLTLWGGPSATVGGRVTDAYRCKIEKLIDAHGLAEQVDLPGYLPEHSVSDSLRGCHALFLPYESSSDTDDLTSTSAAMYEAFTAGVPVVASDVKALREVVKPGHNGFLLAPNDSVAIADSIQAMASDPELVNRLARGAAQTSAELRSARDGTNLRDAYRSAGLPEPRTEVLLPDVAVLATAGPGSGDEARITTLLEGVRPRVIPFDRRNKLRAAVGTLRTLLTRPPEVLVLEGTGLGGGLAALAARMLKGVPYIVSSGDAVGPFIGMKRPGLGVVGGLYERLLYRGCEGFVGWTPYLAGRALALGAPRAMTAANWAPADEADLGLARQEVRNTLGLPADAIVFGLVGSIRWSESRGYAYGLELVKARRRVGRDDVHVVIVGGGDGLDHLVRHAGGHDAIHFVGPVPRAEVPRYLAAFDVASLPQSVDGVGSYRYTTKLSEYVAAGLPLLIGEIPAAYDLAHDWSWRLPGDSPWDDRQIAAIAEVMESVDHEAIGEKRSRVPAEIAEFSLSAQQSRFESFVRDAVLRARSR